LKGKESMSEGHGEDSATVSDLHSRADTLHRAGRLDDALALLGSAGQSGLVTSDEAASEVLRLTLLRAKILTDRIFYANRGYVEAVETLEAADTLAQRLDDQLSAATALDLLGMADYYHVMQVGSVDYGSALQRFQAALARREDLTDSRGVVESLFHVGLVHERLEQYDEALDMYWRAYALARERGHLLEQSYAARHLGGGAQELGDLDAALAYSRESLALRQELGITLLLPLAHIALGAVTLARQDVDGAGQEYEQAHTLADGMQSPLAIVFSLLALSELAHARGNEDARRDYAKRALSRAQEDGLPLGIRGAEAALAAIAQERA
jgi:tetratricopeptide (TPR) repeat protein